MLRKLNFNIYKLVSVLTYYTGVLGFWGFGANFGITKWGSYLDYKVGQKDYKVGQGLQSGAKGLQSGAGITKWGKDYKVGQYSNHCSLDIF